MNKSDAHKKVLSFLDEYTKKDKDIIKEDIKKINEMNCEGNSAQDYFNNFPIYYGIE